MRNSAFIMCRRSRHLLNKRCDRRVSAVCRDSVLCQLAYMGNERLQVMRQIAKEDKVL